ncbi:MAG: hypothetical protein WED33_01330 [Bacteroidia bacterium]
MIIVLRRILLFSFILSASLQVEAQVNVRDSLLSFTMFQVNVGLNFPLNDLKDRFTNFGNLGGQVSRKTKAGWIFGGSGNFLFGDGVKETSMIDAITVGEAFIISSGGTLSDIRYSLRGFSAQLHVGKMFPVWGPNKNCGLFALLSGGMMQHKIRFDTDRNTNAPSLTKEYKKGYDRLSNGLLISPSVGYQYLGNNTTINFFIQVEYAYASTQNRRSYNFDTGLPDTRQRDDSYFNVKIGWSLPIYKKASSDFYYF